MEQNEALLHFSVFKKNGRRKIYRTVCLFNKEFADIFVPSSCFKLAVAA